MSPGDPHRKKKKKKREKEREEKGKRGVRKGNPRRKISKICHGFTRSPSKKNKNKKAIRLVMPHLLIPIGFKGVIVRPRKRKHEKDRNAARDVPWSLHLRPCWRSLALSFCLSLSLLFVSCTSTVVRSVRSSLMFRFVFFNSLLFFDFFFFSINFFASRSFFFPPAFGEREFKSRSTKRAGY